MTFSIIKLQKVIELVYDFWYNKVAIEEVPNANRKRN